MQKVGFEMIDCLSCLLKVSGSMTYVRQYDIEKSEHFLLPRLLVGGWWRRSLAQGRSTLTRLVTPEDAINLIY